MTDNQPPIEYEIVSLAQTIITQGVITRPIRSLGDFYDPSWFTTAFRGSKRGDASMRVCWRPGASAENDMVILRFEMGDEQFSTALYGSFAKALHHSLDVRLSHFQEWETDKRAGDRPAALGVLKSMKMDLDDDF